MITYKKKIDPVMDVFIKQEESRFHQLIINYTYHNSNKKITGFQSVTCEGRHKGENFLQCSESDWNEKVDLHKKFTKTTEAWV